MDFGDYRAYAASAVGGLRQDRPPRRGVNPEFDEHYDGMMANITLTGEEPEDFYEEMRRAAWATWHVVPPAALSTPSRSRDDDEDEELARAIALSTQEHHDRLSRQASAVRTDDEDDEELQKVIAASEEEARELSVQKREETPEEERRMLEEAMAASLVADKEEAPPKEAVSENETLEAASAAYQASREAFRDEERRRRAEQLPNPLNSRASSLPTPPPFSTPSSASSTNDPALPLFNRMHVGTTKLSDRAQMEKERLARQAAREAKAGQPRGSGVATALSQSGQPSIPSAGPSMPRAQSIIHPLQSPGPFPSDAAGEYYLDGELRHSTLTIGEPATEPTFDPQRVIGKTSQISLIIMCSFVLDSAFLDSILPPPDQVPTIVIRPHPREHHPAWNGKVQAQPTGEVFCYPRMVGEYGSAHMKFFWIFYKTGRLRVVIGSANMVPYDWDWIENTIFVQDFLPLPHPVPLRDNHLPHDLPNQFKFLFVHLKVHKALKWLTDNHPSRAGISFSANNGFQDMETYDWSRVKVAVVMSVPGTYDGPEQMDQFGICRLGRVLCDQGWKPKLGEKTVAEFQGSSLGQYSIDWYDLFHQFCTGKTSRQLLGRGKPNVWPPLKVIFPSLATVDASLLGRDGGGTMFVGKGWNKLTSKLFHDANSKRGGVLMHVKMLIALFEPQDRPLGFAASPAKNGKRKADEMEEDTDGGVGGWIYTGSHNFSSAAWGTPNLKRGNGSMNIRNFEMGILFPLARKEARATADRVAPYKRPARPYSSTDLPWDQKAHGGDHDGGD